MTDDPFPKGEIRYSTVLRPHRSASRRALKILTVAVLCASVPTALIFSLIGAWPVFGFMGLEVLALLVALRFNHKAGNTFDAISITDSEFRLSRVDPWGRRRHWSFQAQWTQVRLEGPTQRLLIGSHGKSITVGTFLTPEERARLAGNLKYEIARVVRPCMPAAVC